MSEDEDTVELDLHGGDYYATYDRDNDFLQIYEKGRYLDIELLETPLGAADVEKLARLVGLTQ